MLSDEELNRMSADELRLETEKAEEDWLNRLKLEKAKHDIDPLLGDTAGPGVSLALHYFGKLAFRLVEIHPSAAKTSRVREAVINYVAQRWPGENSTENDRLRDVVHREDWAEHPILKRKLDER